MGITVLAVPRLKTFTTAETEAAALQNILELAGMTDGRLVQLIPSVSQEHWLLAVFQSED
jgi:hypothetical protein